MNRLKGQRRSGTVQICKVNLYVLKPAVMLENLTLFHTFTMTTFHIFQLSSCSAGFFPLSRKLVGGVGKLVCMNQQDLG